MTDPAADQPSTANGTENGVSPPAEDAPNPVDRRSALDRALDAIHHVMDTLGDEGDLSDLDEDERKALRGAAKYAHDHLIFHLAEKSKAESLAAGIIGGMVLATSGMLVGHVLTKPRDMRGGWARDLLTQLRPEHKAMGITALKQAILMVEDWIAKQEPARPPRATPV